MRPIFSTVTNTCIGLYNSRELRPINEALRGLFCVEVMTIDVLTETDDSIFGSWRGIPVRMKVLVDDDNDNTNAVFVEVFFAQTKTSQYTTDFIRLAELATDGVWEWFPCMNYEYMSSRFWSILGYDQKDMVESPSSWMNIIDPDDGKIAVKIFKDHCESRAKVPYYTKVKYPHKNGSEVHVVCRGSVVEWLGDKPWRVVGTHTDVTAIVMKDALKSREQFVSRMSHEIRSPLCAVINECDLLEDKYDLSTIKDACNQILYIANDVLNLQKLKGGKMTHDVVKCNPEDILEKAIKRHRGETKKKGLRLSSSIEELPIEVMLDISKFNQIFDNLMSNAIKYTEKGRISVECEFDASNSSLVVCVEDTGIGIPETDRASIFEEFFQGSTSMRGIGVGLHIVKELCSFMGGDVELVETEMGKGSKFRFSVHMDDVSKSKLEIERKMIRILVVDDIVTNRQYMNRKLQNLEDKMNFKISEIVEASDGLDAVKKFERSKERFDLVLMDCLMPIMDGFSATKKIHELCEKKNIHRVPVIAVTASMANTLQDDCSSAGMICVVTKPFSIKDLADSIKKAI